MKKHGRTCSLRHVRLDLGRVAMFGTSLSMLAHASCTSPSLESLRLWGICGVWISVFCRDDTTWYQQFTIDIHSAECAKAAKTCDASGIRNGDESCSRCWLLSPEGDSSFLFTFRIKLLGISCCNRGCQRHEVPPGVSVSSLGGRRGLRNQCRKCRGSSQYLLKQLPLFSKLHFSNLLQSCGVLHGKLGTGLEWNSLCSAFVRFRAAKKFTVNSWFQLMVGSYPFRRTRNEEVGPSWGLCLGLYTRKQFQFNIRKQVSCTHRSGIFEDDEIHDSDADAGDEAVDPDDRADADS